MPMSSCDQIVLCDGQRRLLLARAGRVSGEHRDVLRARIVLAAAGGTTLDVTAEVNPAPRIVKMLPPVVGPAGGSREAIASGGTL